MNTPFLTPSYETEVQLLRLRVESETKPPATVVVTSAQAGDGKSLTAWSLAESLALAGHNTVLVDANTDVPRVDSLAYIRELRISKERVTRYARPFGTNGLSLIALSHQEIARTCSRDWLADLTSRLRANYDFVIVDAAPLPRNNLALMFTSVCDTTIVTLRAGRLPTKADDVVARTLQDRAARFLGVVLTSKEVIDEFNRVIGQRLQDMTRWSGVERVLSPARTPEREFQLDRTPEAIPLSS